MTNQPTANEIRALVAELKPHSPQEVMGAAASSNLMASMFTAAFTGIGLLLGGTFLMFFLGFGPDPAADSANTGTAQAAEAENTPTGTDGQVATEEQPSAEDADAESLATDSADNNPAQAGSTDTAIEAMGIGEAADPDSKPESLENRLDRILEGLE